MSTARRTRTGSKPRAAAGGPRRATPAPPLPAPAPPAPPPLPTRWEPQPEAQALVRELFEGVIARLPEAQALQERMLARTATRLLDWVDALVLPGSPGLAERLRHAGFVLAPRRGADTCFRHPGADFPDLIPVPRATSQVVIAVESVADYAAVHAIDPRSISGAPGASFRRVVAARGDRAELVVVERHGDDGFQSPAADPALAMRIAEAGERLRCRQRVFARDEDGFDALEHLLTDTALAIGRDRTCDLFFAAEREYWMRRNRAGRIQKLRQDQLGLGWGNHDHHTYRSSRQQFHRLIQVLELLGLQCRERFHPGPEAGWGAQVLEHPQTGIVVFADVDMSPEEVRTDFAHQELAPRESLGTVGLWCALHGESLLDAGMHHLEAQFAFDALTQQLAQEGIGMMPPFTHLPYLRQAFTVAEVWPVRRDRALRLLAQDRLDARQARVFTDEGTLGSHLENLERNNGYKGFNQTGVDRIIAATDPRLRP